MAKNDLFDVYVNLFNQKNVNKIEDILSLDDALISFDRSVEHFVENLSESVLEQALGKYRNKEKRLNAEKEFFGSIFDKIFKIRCNNDSLYEKYGELFHKFIQDALDEKLHYENKYKYTKYDFFPLMQDMLIIKDGEKLFDPVLCFFHKESHTVSPEYIVSVICPLIESGLLNINVSYSENNDYEVHVIHEMILERYSDISNESLSLLFSQGLVIKEDDYFQRLVMTNEPEKLDFFLKNKLIDINKSCDVFYDDGETKLKEHIIDFYRYALSLENSISNKQDKINDMLVVFFNNGIDLGLRHQGYSTTLAHLNDKVVVRLNYNIFQDYQEVFNQEQDISHKEDNKHINALEYFIGESNYIVAQLLYENQASNIIRDKYLAIRLIQKTMLVLPDDDIMNFIHTPPSEEEITIRNDFSKKVFNDFREKFNQEDINQLIDRTSNSIINTSFNSEIERMLLNEDDIFVRTALEKHVNARL